MTMYDVDATELIEGVAEELKKIESIKPPAWAPFIKTGVHKERPPAREDWWYVRAASVLRKVRLIGPIGVFKLRTLYGGKQSRGYKSEVFKKGSGNIIRKILQQLEKAELVKMEKKGVHKGRVITPKGIKLMDSVANKIFGKKPVEAKVELEKPKKAKPEKPKEPIAQKTKEFSEGKEVKKESKEKKKAEAQTKKEKEPPKKSKEEEIPTAEELAKKREEKNG